MNNQDPEFQKKANFIFQNEDSDAKLSSGIAAPVDRAYALDLLQQSEEALLAAYKRKELIPPSFLLNIGNSLFDLGSFDKAEEIMRTALENNERLKSPNAFETIAIVNLLADILVQNEKEEESGKLLQNYKHLSDMTFSEIS